MLSHKMKFQEFLLEMSLEDENNILPTDIYNFYYMNYMLTDSKEKVYLDQDQIDAIRFEMNEIKKKYLNSFCIIVQNQLQKYLDRGRVDQPSFDSKDIDTDDYEILDSLMRKTYRSDMTRRNTNWENLTKHLSGLQKTSELKNIMFLIDRINNSIHNAQEPMLAKFKNSDNLQKALSDSHVLQPYQLRTKTLDLGFLNEEIESGNAYVFDVDDTLIRSGSKIIVVKNGQIINKLTPQEFNTYKKKPDETFDFSEFDQIIDPKKYKAWPILENVNRKIANGKSNSTIYILTARGSGVVNHLEKFLAEHKITSIKRKNIFAIGDKVGTKTVAEKKRDVLEKIKIKHGERVTFFDDAVDNIELAKGIGIKTRHIQESILDEPQKEMDQKVWEGVPPRLRQEIFVQIANGLLFLGEDAPITKLVVAGSLTGLRWTEDSDLDVTVILDVSEEELEDLKSKLPEVNGEFAAGTKHPINYFLMNQDPGLARFDAAYEPLNKEWLKPPKTEGISVADVYDKFKGLFKKIDLEKEEAKRSIVDIKLLERALENSSDPRAVAEKIVQRIQDLDKSVDDLAQTFKKVHKDRNQAFSDYEKVGGGSESPNLQPENVKYKMLERYHYLDFLKQLYKLTKKDGVETPEGFEKVADLLSKNEECLSEEFINKKEMYVTLDYKLPIGSKLKPTIAARKKVKLDPITNQLEKITEDLRREKYSDRPSRLNCIYLAPNMRVAKMWKQTLNRKYVYKVSVSGTQFITDGGDFTQAGMVFQQVIYLKKNLGKSSAFGGKITLKDVKDEEESVYRALNDYWKGEVAGNEVELPEVLVDGEAIILGMVDQSKINKSSTAWIQGAGDDLEEEKISTKPTMSQKIKILYSDKLDYQIEIPKNEERIKIERELSKPKKKILVDFIRYVEKEEDIETLINIILQDGRGELKTTGAYDRDNQTLRVNIKNRALVDVLRTIAHELIHHRQQETGAIDKHPHQDIGGKIEDEANSKAGVYIKKFAKETGTDIYSDEVNILEQINFIISRSLENLNGN